MKRFTPKISACVPQTDTFLLFFWLKSEMSWRADLALFRRVLAQRKGGAGKGYSIHEPNVQCIAKGKEHKKYESRSSAVIGNASSAKASGAGRRSSRSSGTARPTTA
jgi:IS5 family transposase